MQLKEKAIVKITDQKKNTVLDVLDVLGFESRIVALTHRSEFNVQLSFSLTLFSLYTN